MNRGDFRDNFVHPIRRRVRTFDGDQFAVDAEDDRRADFQMNVRRMAINGRLENFVKEFHVRKITILSANASRENGSIQLL
jgi:hypothetical protein